MILQTQSKILLELNETPISEVAESRLDQSKLSISEFNPMGMSFDNSQCLKFQSEEEVANIRDKLANLIAKSDLQDLELYAQGYKEFDLNSLVNSSDNQNLIFELIKVPSPDKQLVLAKFLVENLKLNPNQADINNQTPLFYFAKHNLVALIEHFISAYKADVNQVDSVIQQTAIFYAAASGSIDAIEALARHGADINWRDGNKETPVYYAITKGKMKAVEKIIELGADMNVKNRQGVSPGEFAKKKSQTRIHGLILKALENGNQK